MTTSDLPPAVAEIAHLLAAMPGVVAVVLGGSRAMGKHDAASDWDLGVYYRGALDAAALAQRGTVYPPGSWGRVMNGGAWLTCGGAKVDVLLRDLDVVDALGERAARGDFDVDALLGYAAGVPTYSLLAERAVAVVLRGELAQDRVFPEPLAASAPPRWRFCRDFSLEHARMRAARGDVVGTVAQAGVAAIQEAHARLCERREWVLNEKGIVDRAGLGRLHARFAALPGGAELATWVDAVARDLA